MVVEDAIRPVEPRRLIYEVVIERIKDYIIQNGLGPGDPLPPENELARRFNVSRHSVREAVKSLQTLGMVDARPGAGLFVSDFSFDPLLENLAYGLMFDVEEVDDVTEIRFLVEYGMAQQLLESPTPDQLQQLRRIVERMRKATEEGKYLADADRKFHWLLWRNVGNSVLLKLLDVFWKVREEAVQRKEVLAVPPDLEANFQHHEDMLVALEKNDLAALRSAIVQHYADFLTPAKLERVKWL